MCQSKKKGIILQTKHDGHMQHVKTFEHAIHLTSTMKECGPAIPPRTQVPGCCLGAPAEAKKVAECRHTLEEEA